MHDGVVIHGSFGYLQLQRGLRHEGFIIQITLGKGVGVPLAFVYNDDILELCQIGDNLRDATAQGRLRQQDFGTAVEQAILNRLRAKSREEWADHGAHLQSSKESDIEFWQPFHEDEDSISLLYTQSLEDIGELVALLLELAKSVGLLLSVLALPQQGLLVILVALGMTINALMGHVEKTSRKPVQLFVNILPRGILTGLFEIYQIGFHPKLFRLRLPNNLIIHGYPPS